MTGGQSLPVLYVTGTHYEVGYSTGRTFGENIKRFWKESVEVNTIDIPFHKTAEGKAFFNATLEVCNKCFPQFVQEIQGTADGAGMSFDELFILNLTKEVHNVLCQDSLKERKIKEIAGCTDVLVNTPTCKLIGHNEDCIPAIKPLGYIVSARIVDDNGIEEENFTAYCYPGVLPGAALSFNSSGMVFTMNAFYTIDFVVHGAPTRQFLNRSIIRARTIEEAIELVRNKDFGVAYGFNVNIADVKNPKDFWSIEVGPRDKESMFHVHTVSEEADTSKTCHYIHGNNLKNLKISEIPNMTSAIARTKRAEEFPPPRTRDDILAILGDQTNKTHPIYRSDRPTDHAITALTGIADILRNRVDIYVENPAIKGVLPLMHFSIMDK